MLSPAVWNSGATTRVTSSPDRSVSTRTLTLFQVMLAWERTAPLGRPVVPEVYMIMHGSSGATASSSGPDPAPARSPS